MDTPTRPPMQTSQAGENRGRADAAIAVAAAMRARPNVFIPALLIAIAVVAWFGFQSVHLALEWRQLRLAQSTLQPQEQNAIKLRASLDAVATATAKLAGEGNANARLVVDELRKRGVTINPPAPPKAQ